MYTHIYTYNIYIYYIYIYMYYIYIYIYIYTIFSKNFIFKHFSPSSMIISLTCYQVIINNLLRNLNEE